MRYFEWLLAFQDCRKSIPALQGSCNKIEISNVLDKIFESMDWCYEPICGKLDIDNAYTLFDRIHNCFYTYFKIKETNLKGYHSNMFDIIKIET